MRSRRQSSHVIRALVFRLAARVRAFWTLEDSEERIEGSGEVYLDPAYNSRYTAERRLRQLSTAQEEAKAADPDIHGPDQG